MIEKLKIINDKLIEEYKNNPDELKKQQLIKKILKQKDPFINMNIEYAYSILKDLKIPNEQLKSIYVQLI